MRKRNPVPLTTPVEGSRRTGGGLFVFLAFAAFLVLIGARLIEWYLGKVRSSGAKGARRR